MSVLEAHPHAAAVLGAALRGRPSHAYLFHGPAGSGKREAARAFAAELLARDAPDPENAKARTISGVHPDLTWVAPSGAHIMLRGDVDQSVVAAAGHTPFEASFRVFVLERVDTMDDPAANTLLKTLEEPPSYVVLILLTDKPTQVLPTITSRCQGVRFDPLPPLQLAERLESHGVAPTAARACARLSLGDGERALALALGDGPALRARAEAFARAPHRGRGRPRAAVDRGARRRPHRRPGRRGRGRGGARHRARVPAQEGAPPQADRVQRARPPRRPARRDRRARSRAPARGPVVPRPRLPDRRRRGARVRHRPAGGAARATSPRTRAAGCRRRSSWSRTRAPGSRSTSPTTSRCRRSPTGSSARWPPSPRWHDRRPDPRRLRDGARAGDRGRGRGRGAAGDPRRRRAARRHDAHAGRGRGARARLPPRRGADRRPARGRAAGRPRRQHGRGHRAAAARSRLALVLRDVVVRRLRQGRARGGRRARAAGLRRPADRPRPAGRAARPPAPADVRPHRRPARHRPLHALPASRCSCARTSGATTRWTR